MNASTRTVSIPGPDLEFEVLAKDSIIGPSIERGSWADDETRLLLTHLCPGCRVVDLGANVGWFAVQAILAGAQVDAFEPVPEIAEVCGRNIERASSRGPGRGVLHRSAAGAEPGSAQIAAARDNRGDNRILRGDEVPGDMEEPEILTIEVVRLDDVVTEPVRFLKVDTQGSEWLALQGAQKLLQRSACMGLLIELWPYALRGAQPEELLAHLADWGFTLGKATRAPYPMGPERILRQVRARDPVRGGIDLYGTRGLPFHVGGPVQRLRSLYRSLRED